MAEKEYKCSYKYCLHPDSKVKASESVVINKKHYHWDCATKKQEILECVNTYMNYTEDKTLFPTVCKIINTLAFKNKVPTEFILKKIKDSKMYYSQRPPFALYGLKRLFWEKEFPAR